MPANVQSYYDDTRNIKYKNIHEAIKLADLEGLETLVSQGASVNEVNSKDSDRFTPLHCAAYSGALECLHWLLWHGADFTDTTPHGWTPIHVAAIRGHDSCIQSLAKYGANVNACDVRMSTACHLAAAHGNAYTLQAILRNGGDPTILDRNGWTAVHSACYHGNLACLQVLQRWGAQLEDADNMGNTAIHFSSMEGHLNVLKFLVCNVQDPMLSSTLSNDQGETPLDLAEQFSKVNCIHYLKEVRFETEHPEHKENMAFPAHVAALHGDLEHIRMLIEQGVISVNELDDRGSTCLHKAAGNGQVQIVSWLVEMGADTSILNSAGELALDVARRFGQLACAKILGGDMELFDYDTMPVEDSPRDPGTGDIDVVHMTTEQKKEQRGRAVRKLQELENNLVIAKDNYKQLGGELEEDKLRGELDKEMERLDLQVEVIVDKDKKIAEMEKQLAYERLKREKLETEIDELRVENRNLNNEMEAAVEVAARILLTGHVPQSAHEAAQVKKKKKRSTQAGRPDKTSGVFVYRKFEKSPSSKRVGSEERNRAASEASQYSERSSIRQ